MALPFHPQAAPRAAPLSRELAYWPELLDIVEDLQKGRHTSVHVASYQGSRVAVKVFRQLEGPEEPGLPPRGADLERQVGALYRWVAAAVVGQVAVVLWQ